DWSSDVCSSDLHGPACPAHATGLALSSGAGAAGKSREVLRASLTHQRTRRHEIGERRGDVLIGNVDLLFERIQLRIAENLPPLAMQGAVLWLRNFPAIHLLEIVRSDLFERPRSLGGRTIVMRTNN